MSSRKGKEIDMLSVCAGLHRPFIGNSELILTAIAMTTEAPAAVHRQGLITHTHAHEQYTHTAEQSVCLAHSSKHH